MNQINQKTPAIMITIDVEDWFQVENFKPYIPFSTWDTRELRVEQNVHKLLDLFDSFNENVLKEKDGITNRKEWLNDENEKVDISQLHPEGEKKINQVNPVNPVGKGNSKLANGQNNSKLKIQKSKLPRKVKATFFVLGWIAQRLPNMVREIGHRGHEIASHGYNHELCGNINHSDLKQDLLKSKKLLEDITGSEIYGYRAPSFSIDNDILKVIEDCGYQYDSSYNSFSLHGRYGKVNLNGQPKHGIAIKLSDTFYELPITNLKLRIKNSKFKIELPWGGGGYFRLIPWPIFKYGMEMILNKDKAIIFYMHPWELDASQPKINQAKLNYRFRHYTNLGKTKNKLTELIIGFSDSNFISCRNYIADLDT